MHALIGVNGTEASTGAARFVTGILDPARDGITLYTSPPRIRIDTHSELMASLPEALRAAFARTVFDQVLAELPQEFHSRVQTLTGHVPAEEGILAAASQTKADLIVVGADSHPKRFLIYLGGVAHHVAQRSQIPVLVFRPRKPAAAHDGLRVLLADDGSAAALHAGNVLHDFAWPANSEGWLIRVIEWLDFGSISPDVLAAGLEMGWRTEYDRQLAEVRAQVFEQLRMRQQHLPKMFHRLVPLICDGHRIQEICDTIERERIDLLVVGARNLTPVQRFLGSTSEGLLRHATCSVLVVHDLRPV